MNVAGAKHGTCAISELLKTRQGKHDERIVDPRLEGLIGLGYPSPGEAEKLRSEVDMTNVGPIGSASEGFTTMVLGPDLISGLASF